MITHDFAFYKFSHLFYFREVRHLSTPLSSKWRCQPENQQHLPVPGNSHYVVFWQYFPYYLLVCLFISNGPYRRSGRGIDGLHQRCLELWLQPQCRGGERATAHDYGLCAILFNG